MAGFESNWANTSDVVRNHYGVRDIDDGFGSSPKTEGLYRQAEWTFDFDELPVADAGAMALTIPDNAIIKDCYFQTIEAFVGGTSFDIGFEESDGTDIDLDGLFDLLAIADTNVVGETVSSRIHGGVNSGALLDVAITEPAQLSVVATGTYTAGRARVIVEYIPFTS